MDPRSVWKRVLGTPTEADVGSVGGWPLVFVFWDFLKCWYLLLIDRSLIISAAECGVSSVADPRGPKDGGRCHVLKSLQLHILVEVE